MNIEIITHCWAGQLRQYATMLRCQLASLVNHPPECRVTISVCSDPEDHATFLVLSSYQDEMPHGVSLNVVWMTRPQLFRRAIGRNIVAKKSKADIVWFTDCDYLFGEGCLDALAALKDELPPLSYPRKANIHRDHAVGDAYLDRVNAMPHDVMPAIEPGDFKKTRIIRAIGGVMIVTPELAAMGFCDKSRRMQRPAADGEGWQRSRCDRCARIEWGVGVGKSIQLPNVYRLRHSKISYVKRETPASHD